MTPERLQELTARNRSDAPTINATRAYLVKGLMGYEVEELISEIERLQSQLTQTRERLAKIVVTEGVDAGVVLLSYEGNSHDEEITTADGQKMTVGVYDHEYFSPLGDALVELWEGLQT